MAKTIKRIGIVFSALVFSVLLVVGCVFAVDAKSNELTDLIDNGSLQITVSKEVEMTGDTSDEMAEIWNNAILEAINTGKHIKVVLKNDWVAKKVNDNTTFGTGIGFNSNRISVPRDVEITLDLNGKTIDRGLDKEEKVVNGQVIVVFGKLNIVDSSYTKSTFDYADINNMGKITGASNECTGYGVFGGGIVVFRENNQVGQNGDLGNNSTLNLYCGAIVNNYDYSTDENGGGGIYGVNANINIYGGIIADNSSWNSRSFGGGIFLRGGNLKVYNGLFEQNDCLSFGGGIYVCGNTVLQGKLYIYDGVFQNNQAGYGGGFTVHRNGYAEMYGGLIANNYVTRNGGGVLVYQSSNFIMYGGKITGNTINNVDGVDNNGGGGMYITGGSSATIVEGEISNNITLAEKGEAHGGGISVTSSDSYLYLKGGVIKGNLSKGVAGGIYGAGSNVIVSGGVQIYYNSIGSVDDTTPSDLYLANANLNIDSLISSDGRLARIGIVLASNHASEFTKGYTLKGYGNIDPSRYFFSSKEGKTIQMSETSGEVELVTGEKPTQKVTWKWGEGANESTIENYKEVVYNGTNYDITCSLGKLVYNSKEYTTIAVKNVGIYDFIVQDSNLATTLNPTFRIVVLPKEIDLEWETQLVYNGRRQIPNVSIKEGGLCENDICEVTVECGTSRDAGKNYLATAVSLTNKNYKINPITKSTVYEITPTNLEIDFVTSNMNYEFIGSQIVMNDNWFSLNANLLGDENYFTVDKVFNIDKSALVPQFTKDGVTTAIAVNVGEYDITVKQFDASKVFTGNGNYSVSIKYVNGGKLTITPSNVVRASVESGYDYLVLDNDRRVAYKDRGMIHGENDSNVNVANGNAQYVIGNIMPETSVQTLLSGLVYNQETGAVVVYNKQGDTVADDNAVVGTGWYIEYANERIYLSVLGDVTGDGRIDATDITYLRRVANGEVSNLSLAVQLAAMVDNRGKITSVDAEILRAVCKYEITIDMYF